MCVAAWRLLDSLWGGAAIGQRAHNVWTPKHVKDGTRGWGRRMGGRMGANRGGALSPGRRLCRAALHKEGGWEGGRAGATEERKENAGQQKRLERTAAARAAHATRRARGCVCVCACVCVCV